MYTLLTGIIFLAAGLIAGYLWPQQFWRWGLWICGPLLLLLLLSVAFAGNVTTFMEQDMPLVLLGFVATCTGGFAGARLKKKRQQG